MPCTTFSGTCPINIIDVLQALRRLTNMLPVDAVKVLIIDFTGPQLHPMDFWLYTTVPGEEEVISDIDHVVVLNIECSKGIDDLSM